MKISLEGEKDEQISKNRGEEEGSACRDSGYEADVNAHEVREASVNDASKVQEVPNP